MTNFESAERMANEGTSTEPCSINSLEVHRQTGTGSELSRAWSNNAKQLSSSDLDVSQQGTYSVRFGDSLSGIAKRSLKMQGVDSPDTRAIKAEQARIIDLNSDRYPHLAKNPGYIWENMTLKMIPDQSSDPGQDERLSVREEPEVPAAAEPEPVWDQATPELTGDMRGHIERHGEDDFTGIDLGIFKLGYKSDDHALAFGLDIGILDFDAQLGRESAVDIEAGLGELVGVKGGAGIGVDTNGLHSSANGHGHLLEDNISAGAEVAANLGPKSGVGADGHANVGPLGGAAGGDLSLDRSGLNGGYDATGGIKDVIDGHTRGSLSLSKDSTVGASAGIGLFDNSLDLGAGIGSDRNTSIKPIVEMRGSSGQDSLRGNVHGQIGPALDLSIGTGYRQLEGSRVRNSKNIDAGIGMNGVGVEIETIEDGRRFVSKHGAGKFRSRYR